MADPDVAEHALRKLLEQGRSALSDEEVKSLREVLVLWETWKAWGKLGKLVLWTIMTLGGLAMAVTSIKEWAAKWLG